MSPKKVKPKGYPTIVTEATRARWPIIETPRKWAKEWDPWFTFLTRADEDIRGGNMAREFPYIRYLPGNTQIAVSHNAFVFSSQRGKGVGQALHADRLHTMRRLGYDAAICTVKDENAPQIHILEKNGWYRAMTFVSSYTGNKVHLYCKVLREAAEPQKGI